MSAGLGTGMGRDFYILFPFSKRSQFLIVFPTVSPGLDTHKNTPVYELFYHFEIIIFAACKRKYSNCIQFF